jgi:serine/threonine protein kinase
LDHEDIAQLLGVSDKTVQRHWAFAKAWLARAIQKGNWVSVSEALCRVTGIERHHEPTTPTNRAIQSAHQKGIIHRDLKPSNVLVTWVHPGADAHPMVIDFGVAKAINQKLTDKTLFTHFATVIGTPAYMSPEQARRAEMQARIATAETERANRIKPCNCWIRLWTRADSFGEGRWRSWPMVVYC